MQRIVTLGAICAVAVIVAGCFNVRYAERRSVSYHSASSGMTNENALQAVKIEMTMEASGRHGETEYHIRPDEVPQAVHQAMEARFPGGRIIGAEREINNGRMYYELAKEIDGFEVEAMFHPDGTPHDQEIQVPASKVPQAVQDAIKRGWPGGSVTAWEEINDGAGNLKEYHVKLTDGDKAYKVAVSKSGTLKAAWREIPAEIEVPVKLP